MSRYSIVETRNDNFVLDDKGMTIKLQAAKVEADHNPRPDYVSHGLSTVTPVDAKWAVFRVITVIL